MEEFHSENYPKLNIKPKSQLLFGESFSEKISELKIFIYGLRGVNQLKYYLYNKKIIRF